MGVDTEAMWTKICEVVLRSLFCVADRMGHHPNCFELFGYDVLIDDQLNAHLIEVNSSPALTRHNELDYDVKHAVVADTIHLAAGPSFDREKLAQLLRSSDARPT